MSGILDYLNTHAGTILETWMVMNLQLAVFAAVILALDSALKSASPRFRYLLWTAALVKAMIPPVFTFPGAAVISETVLALPAVTVSLLPESAQAGWSAQAIVVLGLIAASASLAIMALMRHIKLHLSLRDAEKYDYDGDGDVRWPEMFVSTRIFSPLAAGFMTPRIYLTDEVVRGSLQMRRAVLFHELAHIRRGDRFVVVLQTLLQVVYVLNPMMWLINIRLFRYRELICDEYAVERTAVRPKDYGRLLLGFAEAYSKPVIDMQMGTCFFETRRGFVMRISTLFNDASERRLSAKHMVTLILVSTLIIPLSWQCTVENEPESAPATGPIESNEPASSSEQSGENGSDESDMVVEVPPKIVGGMAQLQKNVVYPEEALKQGIEGTVLYTVTVSASGDEILSITVNRSAHPLLEEAGKEAIRATKFSPGMKNGKPAESTFMIPIKFKLN